MKVLIAPDKFKGSLTAQEVCMAIGKGIHRFDEKIELLMHPLADGGDGSLEVIKKYIELTSIKVNTVDPIGRGMEGEYFLSDQNDAYIELANASGLRLLKPNEFNPIETNSFGTGLLIKDALSKKVNQIFLFLGGSATNDAGIGIAAALGFRFVDLNENVLAPKGGNLIHISKIIPSRVPALSN